MIRVLEVIACNKQDVEALNNSVVDRIELCVDLEKEGLSPSLKEVKRCLEISEKPIRVMIRLNEGYESKGREQELTEYLLELKKLNLKKLDGFVLGFTKNDKLDVFFCNELINVAHPLKITLNKVSDMFINTKELDLIHFDTVLTQGGVQNISLNKEIIKKIPFKHNVLLGGGINIDNFHEINKLKTSIHLGRFSRLNQSYDNEYDLELLSKLKKQMTV